MSKNSKFDPSGIEFWLSMIFVAIMCLQLATCASLHGIESEIRQLKYHLK